MLNKMVTFKLNLLLKVYKMYSLENLAGENYSQKIQFKSSVCLHLLEIISGISHVNTLSTTVKSSSYVALKGSTSLVASVDSKDQI